MDFDLSSALHDAARDGTATRPDLPPAPVMQRIRRRRTVRTVGESTVGIAAAGAVAFGAVQLVDARGLRPAPPATSTPIPTSTTDDPTPWPVVGLTGTDGFVCGRPVPTIADPPGDADLHFEAVLAEPTVTSGEPVAIDAVLVNGSELDLDATTSTDHLQLWYAQGGTVVGGTSFVTPGGPAPDVRVTGTAGARVSQPLSGVPGACTSGADGGTSLPAGAYDVYLTQELSLADGGTLQVAGGPVPVVVQEPPATTPPPPTTEPTTPADPVDAHPDAEDLVISPAGLGPLAVGRPPTDNPGAAMIEWDPDLCDELSSESPGRWVPSGYAPEDRDGEPRPLFHVAADEDQVGRIDVLSPTIRTADGVGVGTTVAELRAAYPDLSGPFESPLSRVWWLTGPTGTLVFETQGPESGMQPEGTPESVILMRVLAAGVDPAFATANSDDIAGGCL